MTDLIADCRLAAKVMAETGTFESGQSIFLEAASEIERLTSRVAFLEGMVTSGQGEQIKMAADLLQEKILHNAAKDRLDRLEDALRRIITPAPGVTEPAPPWSVGIARAALERDGQK